MFRLLQPAMTAASSEPAAITGLPVFEKSRRYWATLICEGSLITISARP